MNNPENILAAVKNMLLICIPFTEKFVNEYNGFERDWLRGRLFEMKSILEFIYEMEKL